MRQYIQRCTMDYLAKRFATGEATSGDIVVVSNPLVPSPSSFPSFGYAACFFLLGYLFRARLDFRDR